MTKVLLGVKKTKVLSLCSFCEVVFFPVLTYVDACTSRHKNPYLLQTVLVSLTLGLRTFIHCTNVVYRAQEKPKVGKQ